MQRLAVGCALSARRRYPAAIDAMPTFQREPALCCFRCRHNSTVAVDLSGAQIGKHVGHRLVARIHDAASHVE
jgi:hypothetical protein